MKLFFSQTSPFVRMVRVVAAHHGLTSKLDLIPSGLFSDDESALRAANPLAKIPVLMRDNGQVIYDSRVIIAFLDAHGEGERLLDPTSPSYIDRQTRLALLMGILDAGIAAFLDQRRNLPNMPDAMALRWKQNIAGGVDQAAQHYQGNDPLFRICLPIVLDWIRYRLPDINWQDDHPEMASWMATELAKPIFDGTNPRDA